MDELVSIIIPVFNSEKYIGACLNSLLNQTYKFIEIIIVDDGSRDNTLRILHKYEEVDKRIIVVSNSHNGVSYSRNTGLDLAKGDKLLFIDSDDVVSKYYVEYMKKNSFGADLTICRMGDRFFPFANKTVERVLKGKISGCFKKDYFVLQPFLYGPCLKLFSMDIIKKYNIRFPEDISYAEDEYFNLKYYHYVKKYSFVDECLYYYNHRFNNSLSSIHSVENFQGYLKKFMFEIKTLRKLEIDNRQTIIDGHAYLLIKTFLYMGSNDNYNEFKKRLYNVKKVWKTSYEKNNNRMLESILWREPILRCIYILGGIKYYIRKVVFRYLYVKFLYSFLKSKGL